MSEIKSLSSCAMPNATGSNALASKLFRPAFWRRAYYPSLVCSYQSRTDMSSIQLSLGVSPCTGIGARLIPPPFFGHLPIALFDARVELGVVAHAPPGPRRKARGGVRGSRRGRRGARRVAAVACRSAAFVLNLMYTVMHNITVFEHVSIC